MENLGTEIVRQRDEINRQYDDDIYRLDADDAYKKLTRVYTNCMEDFLIANTEN